MEDIDKLMAFIDCKLPQLLIIIRQILFLGWEKKYVFVIRPQFFLYQLTLFVDTARSLINSSYEGQTLNTFSEGILFYELKLAGFYYRKRQVNSHRRL